MNVDSKYAISLHKLTIHRLIFGAQYYITYINKLTPQGITNFKYFLRS